MAGTEYVYLDAHMKGIVGAAAATRHVVSGADKVIAPFFSNQGMLPFLRNLLCSMGRLQVESWFVVGMDENTCPNLWPGQPAPEKHVCVEPYKERPLVSGGKLRFGGSEFWKLVIQRPLWIYWLAQEGYSVLQVHTRRAAEQTLLTSTAPQPPSLPLRAPAAVLSGAPPPPTAPKLPAFARSVSGRDARHGSRSCGACPALIAHVSCAVRRGHCLAAQPAPVLRRTPER